MRRTVEGPLSRSCWYRGHNEAGGRRKTAYECGVAAAAFRSSKNALAPPIARPGHPTPPCCRRSVSSRFTYGTGKPIGSLGADVFLADPSWGSRARRQRSSWRRSRSRWAGRGMSRWIATCWPPRLEYQHPGPRLRVKVPEVLHGQGDVPAAVGILTRAVVRPVAAPYPLSLAAVATYSGITTEAWASVTRPPPRLSGTTMAAVLIAAAATTTARRPR
jgi:hypothetical protein